MSLDSCMKKFGMIAGKKAERLEPEDLATLRSRVEELQKSGTVKKDAERQAVSELHEEAKSNKEYIESEIRDTLPKDILEKADAKKTANEARAKAAESDAAERQARKDAPREAYQPGHIERLTDPARGVAEKLFGKVGAQTMDNVTNILRAGVGRLEFVSAIVQRMAHHMPEVKVWDDARLRKDAARGAFERKADVLAQKINKLSSEQRAAANAFLAKSTVEQKWGHQPKDFGRDVEIDPKFEAEFKKLDPKVQHIVDETFKFGEQIYTDIQAATESVGGTDLFSKHTRLLGPYVHLDRAGEYVTILKSKDYEDATPAERAVLEKDAKHYIFKTFPTFGQATEFRDANKSKYASAIASDKLSRPEGSASMSPVVLQRMLAALHVDDKIPPEAKAAMTDSVHAMWLASLDRSSARQAENRRRGIAGFDEDVLGSTMKHALANASHIANIRHGGALNGAFHEMYNASKDANASVAKDFNLIAKHHAISMEYKATPIQDGITAMTSAWQLATSPAYHLSNFSQVVMTTLPRLAADFGAGNYGTAWKHVIDGYRQMAEITNDKGMTIDLNKVKDSGLRDLLNRAMDSGLLDVGMAEDIGHLNRTSTGYKSVDATSGLAAQAIHKLRTVSSAVERWNRVSAATAAFNMARAKGMDVKAAGDYAMDMLETTQGNFSRGDAPLLLKQLPKVVGQYKKFQLMMMAYYTKAFMSAFRGVTPEERAIGRRMLQYKLLHTTFAAGALGLPMVNAASLIYDQFFGPDTFDHWVRDKLGDDMLGKMLTEGVVGATGIGLGAKLGDENVFSIMPYTDIDLSSSSGIAKTAAGLAGPSTAEITRMLLGVNHLQNGEFSKGMEALLPKGLADMAMAFRLNNAGYSISNGDVVVSPKDISTYGLLLTGMGLSSTEVKHVQAVVNEQYDIAKDFKSKEHAIEKKYDDAFKAKDSDAIAKLRADWMAIQKKKLDFKDRFKQLPDEMKNKPLATLLQYPQRRQVEEQNRQKQYLSRD